MIRPLEHLASTYLLHALPYSIANSVTLVPYKYDIPIKSSDIQEKMPTPIAIFELFSCGLPPRAGTVWATS